MTTSHRHDGNYVVVESGQVVNPPAASVVFHVHDPETGDAIGTRQNHHHDENGIVWEVDPEPSSPPVEVTQSFEGERVAGGLLSDRQAALAAAIMCVHQWGQVASPQQVVGYAETFLAFLRADDNETEA